MIALIHNRILHTLFLSATVLLMSVSLTVNAATQPKLTLKEFILQASKNDTTFEAILIDQMPLKYRRDLFLPDSDFIVDAKLQHNFYLDQDRDNPEASIALSKLFPYQGTKLSITYNKTSSATTAQDESSLQFLITQPIAKNAFGNGTQLLDKIIGIENEIIRYQVIEAYEDYLASLTTAYYNWYSAYENLKVGEASYKSNQKLMNNILERQRQKIALPIDVNKMALLLTGKNESLVVLREIYQSYSNIIFSAIRHDTVLPYVPVKPGTPASKVDFYSDYQKFTDTSRTYKALRLLENQGALEVKKAADDLLPSTNLLLGYQLDGNDWDIRNEDSRFFAGISVRWPINRTVDNAKHKLAQIERKKTTLSNQNKYEDLHTNLKNLHLQIKREQKLISIAKKKIKLAESILKDEAENYSFGKVTLNDYIDAVNRVDENRFSYTDHSVKLNKLIVEWLRLTDKLVDESSIPAGS